MLWCFYFLVIYCHPLHHWVPLVNSWQCEEETTSWKQQENGGQKPCHWWTITTSKYKHEGGVRIVEITSWKRNSEQAPSMAKVKKDGEVSADLFSCEMQIQWGRKFMGNYESTATGEWASKAEVMEGVLPEICIKILVVVCMALGGIFSKVLNWAQCPNFRSVCLHVDTRSEEPTGLLGEVTKCRVRVPYSNLIYPNMLNARNWHAVGVPKMSQQFDSPEHLTTCLVSTIKVGLCSAANQMKCGWKYDVLWTRENA